MALHFLQLFTLVLLYITATQFTLLVALGFFGTKIDNKRQTALEQLVYKLLNIHLLDSQNHVDERIYFANPFVLLPKVLRIL